MSRTSRLLIPLLLCVVGVDALAQREARESTRPLVGRSMVATRYGIVAASQPLAARAGVQILERGMRATAAAMSATVGSPGRITAGVVCANVVAAAIGRSAVAWWFRIRRPRTNRCLH